MIKNIIQNEILSYGITPYDIKMALDLLPGSHYFMPWKEGEHGKFEIYRENENTSIAFPSLCVKMLLMILNKLSQGEAPILLQQYTELNLDDVMYVLWPRCNGGLNISKQQ